MTDDIVARLRGVEHGTSWPLHPRFGEVLAKDAADEIERLRAERDEARRAMCKDEAIIRLQRDRVHRDSEEVARITKEIAVEREWDCFKEATDGRG